MEKQVQKDSFFYFCKGLKLSPVGSEEKYRQNLFAGSFQFGSFKLKAKNHLAH